MEVKLRTEVAGLFPGIEGWGKYALSKKNYAEEYKNLLKEHRLPEDDALEKAETVEVLKVRRQGRCNGGKEEITALHPTFSSVDEKRSERSWITLCVEGTCESALANIVKTADFSPLLCDCLVLALELQYDDLDWAITTHFFPLLSGYPAWVHCLASPEHTSSGALVSPLLLFLEAMERSPPRLLPKHLFSSSSDEVILKYTKRDDTTAAVPVELGNVSFDFSSFPALCTPRLMLREVQVSDAQDVFGFRGDYEVTKYNCGDAYATIAQVEGLILSQVEQFEKMQAIRWGISQLDHSGEGWGPVMGMVGYNYWDRTDRRASIGLELHQFLWGKGIMTEALLAVLRFGFDQMGLNRIEAAASEYNGKCID
ncbi:yoaA, partial [Symbiodinium microadriaticum]